MTLHKSAWINNYGPLFSNRVPGEVCPVQDHHFVRFDDSRSAVIQKVRWSQYSQIHPAVCRWQRKSSETSFAVFFFLIQWSNHVLFYCRAASEWRRRAKQKLFGRSFISKHQMFFLIHTPATIDLNLMLVIKHDRWVNTSLDLIGRTVLADLRQ